MLVRSKSNKLLRFICYRLKLKTPIPLEQNLDKGIV